MKIKTSELKDKALDWAVALALGANAVKAPENQLWMLHWSSPLFGDQPRWSMRAPAYSTDWSQGGPIIEREGINTYQMQDGAWQANLDYGMVDEAIYHGPTPLIAAMRCFVASKLGDEVDIPEELL